MCIPLPTTKAVLYFARALESVDPQRAALIGFAGVMGYLAVFLPALVLFEPFAIVASVWYTRRRLFDDWRRGPAEVGHHMSEPIGRLFACWLAVIVHTAVLISYFRLGR